MSQRDARRTSSGPSGGQSRTKGEADTETTPKRDEEKARQEPLPPAALEALLAAGVEARAEGDADAPANERGPQAGQAPAPEAADPSDEPEPFSIYDLFEEAKQQKKSVRKLPGLLRASLALVWAASPRDFAMSAALEVVVGAGAAVSLLAGKEALEGLLMRGGRGLGEILPSLLVLTGVSLVTRLLGALRMERQVLLADLVKRQAESRIFDVSSAMDLEAFEAPGFFDRLQRALANASFRPMSMVWAVLGLASGMLGIVGVGIALFAMQPLLLPLVGLAYLPLWIVRNKISRDRYQFFLHNTPNERERQYIRGVLGGRDEAKEVRAFDLSGMLRERYSRLYDDYLDDLRQRLRKRVRMSMVAEVLSGVMTAGTLGVVVWLFVTRRMSLATAGASVAALRMLSSRVETVGHSASSLYEAGLFLEDYTSFLELMPEVEARRPTAEAPADFKTLEAQGISFTYPGSTKPALEDVSLRLSRGEVVALVGENGSGKTTLAKILAHLYQPQKGRILWDGTDTSQCDRQGLRRSIALIFQDFVRYKLPARDNIGMGRHDRASDLDAVVTAAQRVGAHDFLSKLPNGYDTLLTKEFKGGRDLSVGQWQRVALGRAFFRDAPFIILDEPTAALDPRAEYELFERVRDLCSGRSVLLISHRFSSVRSADRIYVLESGRVVEAGRHEELMERNGLYAELFTLQASAYLDTPSRPAGEAPGG
ncbi:MAG TPA: ABC transporter ATP-binding protein [Actinomycetota bacterium]|nr:ABC transporter ATP-binding protein [Actinomycetota bacterium]